MVILLPCRGGTCQPSRRLITPGWMLAGLSVL